MNYKNGHKCDYKFKSQVLKNTDLIKLQKNVSKALFLKKDIIVNYHTGEILTLDDAKFYDMIYCNDDEYIEATKINNCSYHRSKRLKQRITDFIKMGDCVFLTLTFTDDILNSTNDKTRKVYVKRFLKQISDYYVANIDFGGKNGREHYHAVVLGSKIDYSLWHKYGAINGERVRSNNVSDVKLAKYISKLTNHAIKETTKRNAIIYSSISKARA